MKAYLKYLFSWKGEASRLELLGIYILCGFGIPALAIAGCVFLNLILDLMLNMPTNWVYILAGILFVPIIIYLVLTAIVRRLRHIGVSPLWIIAIVPLLFLPMKLIPVLGCLALIICPPFKNSSPNPHTPSYFLRHLIFSIFILVIPMAAVIGLGMLTKTSPKFVEKFISKEKLEATDEEMEITKQKRESQHQAGIEKLIPPGIDPSLVIPYEGQDKPAISIGKPVQDISQNTSGRVGDIVWSWPVPDTIPTAEQLDWTNNVYPCLSKPNCKHMEDKGKTMLLRIQYWPEMHTYSQILILQEGSGVRKEMVIFSEQRVPLSFHRYKDNKKVQSFRILPNEIWFRDASFDHHPAFSATNQNSVGEVWFHVHNDGSFTPVRFLDPQNPFLNQSVYPRDRFNAPWPGIHPSAKFVNFMFPTK